MAKKKMTIEDLAVMTKRGFDSVHEVMDKRFEKVESEIHHMGAEMTIVRRDTEEIKKHFVYRYEFEDVLGRVAYIERKLKIKSGK